MQIRELIKRDLNDKIEEIIKVDQEDEEVVYKEITEYVVTPRILEEYRMLFRAIADAPSEPHEGIGVWISGFFGSGKSSFAKNLGYVLANREVLGYRAADLFKNQLDDPSTGALIDSINTRIPTHVVMFDVSVDRAVKKATERIAEIMYTVLLRELDYAEDYDIAELEIELEREGRLEEFMRLCSEMGHGDWRQVRKGAMKISRASAILHKMDPATFPEVESWARSIGAKQADITVNKFVDRAFELMERRRPGMGLVFIIDEVGQYVARSADKIEDLRAVVERFGQESRNRLKARKIVAPVWIVVTSQERLDEVVAAIDSKRVELAKLQDRFRWRVDLAPADIRQVATRRVLAKRPEKEDVLRRLYADWQGQLNTAIRLERTTRKTELTEDEFVQFYPYLPHFIDLSIDIMSGIRVQNPNAPRHLGGSNRTIIKQAYEMLVSERTNLANKPVGKLVSLDLIYELVEANLSSEKFRDINEITTRFRDDPEDRGWAARVAKAITLLEFVRDLPRTEHNIAAVLVDRVDMAAPLQEVKDALRRLVDAQFVRNTEEGYKLLTPTDRNWETEKQSLRDPRPKDRNEIIREVLRDIFTEPRLRTYGYRDLRTFRIGITVDDVRVGDEGQINLSLLVAEDSDELSEKVAQARNESREHTNDLYWVFALTPEIDDMVANLFASRQMIARYEQMRAQNKINTEEAISLASEKNEATRTYNRLKDKVVEALARGQGLFRGMSKDASDLGKSHTEIFKRFLDFAVPDLYPKLEIGARPLRGNEAEEFLKAANLNALPQIFYDGEQGLNLVVKEGPKYVPNTSAEIAKEVLDYLKHEDEYGNKVTGKTLEEHFASSPYGWEREMLQLVLAVLLRARAIEVTYQGRRFRNYQEPQVRQPFTSTIAFRAASYSPGVVIDLPTLRQAVERLEDITGEEVDFEEGAVAERFKKLADEEMERLLPLRANVQARNLPVDSILDEYADTLEEIRNSASDDCVRILAGQGKWFRDMRETVRRIRDTLTPRNLELLEAARVACEQMWPVLSAHATEVESLAATAEDLQAMLKSPDFYQKMPQINKAVREIRSAYRSLYERYHRDRTEALTEALDQIKGRPDWAQLPLEMQQSVLVPLTQYACDMTELPEGAERCPQCRSTVAEMKLQLDALPAIKAQVIANIQERLADLDEQKRPVRRVRLAQYFDGALTSREEVKAALERLQEELYKLLDEGAQIIVE
jgi:hypothetical protein